MASSAERLLQAQSLHLLHETILHGHCCKQVPVEESGQRPIGDIPGRRCESGPRPLCPCDGRQRNMFWHRRRRRSHRWNRSGSGDRAPWARPCRCQTLPAIGIEDVGVGAMGVGACRRTTGVGSLFVESVKCRIGRTGETKIGCGGLGSCDGREQWSYWRSYVGSITSLARSRSG